MNKIFLTMFFLLPILDVYAAECTLLEKICTEGAEERVIDGFKVYRECWKYQNSYQCSGFAANNCFFLRENGCEQIDSVCKERKGDWCISYEQKFRCSATESYKRKEVRYRLPTFKDQDLKHRKHIACGEEIKCVDGKCFKQTYDINSELSEAVTMLHALKEMQNKNSENPITVFGGHYDSCKKRTFGINNCCKEGKSWVEKARLSECKASDKALMEKKVKNLCIAIGSKKKKKAGLPSSTEYGFCCFDSRLVKVIEEQGRLQLGRSFGSPSSPDCKGLTVDELQKMDFSKMNLSELVEEMVSKTKSVDVIRVKGILENELRLMKQDLYKPKIEGQNAKYNEEGIL